MINKSFSSCSFQKESTTVRKKDAVRTARVNSVFEYMRGLARLSEKKKSEEGKPTLLFPALVENTGVEPVTSCMPCKRSSQLS